MTNPPQRGGDELSAVARPALTAEIKPVAAPRAPVPAAALVASNTPAEPGAHGEIDPASLWSRVLQLASENMVDRHRVEHLIFQSFDGTTLRVSLDDGSADIARFVVSQIDRITELAKKAAGGRAVRVEIDTSSVTSRTAASASAVSGPLPPIVQKAVDLFGATVIAVE